jgi:hypothetical protein
MRAMRRKRPGRPEGRKTTYTVYAQIDERLGKTLEKWLTGSRPKPSLKAVIEMLVEDFLIKEGVWPPSEGRRPD